MALSASPPVFKNRIVRWIDYRVPIFTFMHHQLDEYPTPRNLSYWWNFGSLAGITLVIMILTGITLAMHYTPEANSAFASVEHIMRDVNYGWLIRYLHTTGASMFFALVYLHTARGLYYGSYKAPRELLWIIGVTILVVMMATAFFGYTLPWGQMSFWGATVITNLLSAIPVIGSSLVLWLQGGFSIGDATLHRFYSLHYLLPFVIVGLVFFHLWALHRFGSNNPLGIEVKSTEETLPFHPYFTIKDLFGLGIFLIVYSYFVFFTPDYLLSPDNSIPANPLSTPSHIVPEWYLLPYYAILRAIPNKLAGVIAMFGSIGVLFLVPWLDTSRVRSARFRPVYRVFFWLLMAAWLVLAYCGSKPPEGAYVTVARIAATYYFAHFLILLPMIGVLETPSSMPTSISGTQSARSRAPAPTESS
jgi:quinol-cytochrome oxidoreductase complex cytochrome b subunit